MIFIINIVYNVNIYNMKKYKIKKDRYEICNRIGKMYCPITDRCRDSNSYRKKCLDEMNSYYYFKDNKLLPYYIDDNYLGDDNIRLYINEIPKNIKFYNKGKELNMDNIINNLSEISKITETDPKTILENTSGLSKIIDETGITTLDQLKELTNIVKKNGYYLKQIMIRLSNNNKINVGIKDAINNIGSDIIIDEKAKKLNDEYFEEQKNNYEKFANDYINTYGLKIFDRNEIVNDSLDVPEYKEYIINSINNEIKKLNDNSEKILQKLNIENNTEIKNNLGFTLQKIYDIIQENNDLLYEVGNRIGEFKSKGSGIYGSGYYPGYYYDNYYSHFKNGKYVG